MWVEDVEPRGGRFRCGQVQVQVQVRRSVGASGMRGGRDAVWKCGGNEGGGEL